MSAILVFFALVMAAAFAVDVGIARDSVKRGWFALAAFSSVAALCAAVAFAFTAAALVNGGAS